MLFSQDSRYRAELTELVLVLIKASSDASACLPAKVIASLGILVRSLNCYYSNLIEGHRTRIFDIERSLDNDYSTDPSIRNLQLEAKSHIEVQDWLESRIGEFQFPMIETLCEIHRLFFKALPKVFRSVDIPESNKLLEIIPGNLRTHNVQVGRHLPVSPGAVPRFLQRFEAVYGNLGVCDRLLALAAAHHRLLWIHPFPDGNGRVARLMSDAMLQTTLGAGIVWTASRGLARTEGVYKALLANCDLPRRNDLDGRGVLSEESLFEFTKYFLETCIEQAEFMKRLIQPEQLRARIAIWAETEIRMGILPAKSDVVLEFVMLKGSLPRGEVVSLLGLSDRQARRITSALIHSGSLTSKSSRAPLTLAFPSKLAMHWLPGLLPE